MPEDHRDLLLARFARGAQRQPRLAAATTWRSPARLPSRRRSSAPAAAPRSPPSPLPFLELPYFNGLGGFTQDGREYAIYLTPGSKTPAPWANVMAQFAIRRDGHRERPRMHLARQQPDQPSDAVAQRSRDATRNPKRSICATKTAAPAGRPPPQPIRENDAYRARHGQGYTVFEHNSHAIGQELTVFVPLNDDGTGDPGESVPPAPAQRFFAPPPSHRRLFRRVGPRDQSRRSAAAHANDLRSTNPAPCCARQSWNGSQTDQIGVRRRQPPRGTSYSGDRTPVPRPQPFAASKPAALERARLDNRTGAGLDPAAALQLEVTLERGAQMEVVFLLGEAATIEEVAGHHQPLSNCRASGARLGRDAQLVGHHAGRAASADAHPVHRFSVESLAPLPSR